MAYYYRELNLAKFKSYKIELLDLLLVVNIMIACSYLVISKVATDQTSECH